MRAAVLLLFIACARSADPLPPTAGDFTGGPLTKTSDFERRAYSRGPIHIELTLAKSPTTDDAFAQWAKASAEYRLANLDAPAEKAVGFYDCDGQGDAERCSLHIQTRSGYHLEVMGGGTARQRDLDELISHIPVKSLADR